MILVIEVIFGRILLRDMQPADIEDVIRWNTVETEWQNWDAPWEFADAAPYDWDAYRVRKREEILAMRDDSTVRTRLEICLRDERKTHIGAVSCYRVGNDWRITDSGTHVAVGLTVYAQSLRGRGYGGDALCAYIDYLGQHAIKDVYTQTWSGNTPMIALAQRAGFMECNRFPGIRVVRGERYDALTFRLDRGRYKRYRDGRVGPGGQTGRSYDRKI